MCYGTKTQIFSQTKHSLDHGHCMFVNLVFFLSSPSSSPIVLSDSSISLIRHVSFRYFVVSLLMILRFDATFHSSCCACTRVRIKL